MRLKKSDKICKNLYLLRQHKKNSLKISGACVTDRLTPSHDYNKTLISGPYDCILVMLINYVKFILIIRQYFNKH